MAHPQTAEQVAEAVQVVAHQPAPAPEAGFFDSMWSLLSSAMGALATWAGAHWGDIGLGVLAILATYIATVMARHVIDWATSENRKRPVEMAEDTHNLLVRLASLTNGTAFAISFGFGEHFGSATGLTFGAFEAAVIGGLMNSGACVFAFHAWKWITGNSKSARDFRAILRIKMRRRAGVTEVEIEAARTTTGRPPITEDMIATDRENKGLDDGNNDASDE